jgi:hypothetical protein
VAVRHDDFEGAGDFTCGTTNIDFSARLHNELDRMRDYRKTRLDLGPGGLTVKTEGQDALKEKKIDLPESWVKGFLQVQSTRTLGLTHFQLEPVDLFNLLRFLRRHKARVSPRALRYELVPGKRVRVVFEPWEEVLEFGRCSAWDGPKAMSVRTWGRERLRTLARLLPVAQKIDVFLAGFGLPTVYVVDLGGATFTLALSGWTDNDWTSGGTKFDLLSRRMQVSPGELTTCLDALKKVRRATDVGLAQDTGQGLEKTRSALSYLCQVGRAMYDLGGGVYRHRELFTEPFTIKDAVAAVQGAATAKPGAPSVGAATTQEASAQGIFTRGGVLITARRPVPAGGYKLTGSVKGTDNARYRPLLTADGEGRIVEATCTCAYAQRFGLTKGPCEHVLALRLAHMSRLEAEDKGGV